MSNQPSKDERHWGLSFRGYLKKQVVDIPHDDQLITAPAIYEYGIYVIYDESHAIAASLIKRMTDDTGIGSNWDWRALRDAISSVSMHLRGSFKVLCGTWAAYLPNADETNDGQLYLICNPWTNRATLVKRPCQHRNWDDEKYHPIEGKHYLWQSTVLPVVHSTKCGRCGCRFRYTFRTAPLASSLQPEYRSYCPSCEQAIATGMDDKVVAGECGFRIERIKKGMVR